MSDPDLYESDFVRWADEQAAELRRRANGADTAIDWLDVAEEIKTPARADRREIRDQLVVCPWAVDQVINHDFWPP